MSEQIKVSRPVDASPGQVFALLADPGRHVEFDGSGMMRGLAEGAPITGVGDTFLMNMSNPILGDYQVRCTVRTFEPDRAIAWGPQLFPADGYTDKLGDMVTGGHTFTWELAPSGSGGTTVTQTEDWSGVEDSRFKEIFPIVTEPMLLESIDRLGKVAG
ncbi:MAG TPA: SRPBCC family protein [Sporichthya sp.]|nr:SRPBCC family protein [Sporichthya sp.]